MLRPAAPYPPLRTAGDRDVPRRGSCASAGGSRRNQCGSVRDRGTAKSARRRFRARASADLGHAVGAREQHRRLLKSRATRLRRCTRETARARWGAAVLCRRGLLRQGFLDGSWSSGKLADRRSVDRTGPWPRGAACRLTGRTFHSASARPPPRPGGEQAVRPPRTRNGQHRSRDGPAPSGSRRSATPARVGHTVGR